MNEEQKKLILALRTELGDYLPKETKDEDLLVEAKVVEFRKIKEDAIKAKEEADKKVADEAVTEVKAEAPVAEVKVEVTEVKVETPVEEVKAETTTQVREETMKVTDVINPDNGTETVKVETTSTVTQDGKPVAESKRVEETVYTFAQVEAIKAEYEQKLVAKDAEIVKIKETAEKIATRKFELKSNEFAKDFTDADYLDDTKVENAILKFAATKEVVTVEASAPVVLATGHKKVDASEDNLSPLSKILKNKKSNKR